jgi:hypothetical protein
MKLLKRGSSSLGGPYQSARQMTAMLSAKFLLRQALIIFVLYSIINVGHLKSFQFLEQDFGSNSISCATMYFPKRSQAGSPHGILHNWNAVRDFVIAHELTYLPREVLAFHRNLIDEIEQNGIPGMIFECGVAKAGSSITFAAAKNPQRCLHLFDTFEGIPEPSEERDGKDIMERYKKIQQQKLYCQQGKKTCDKSYYGNMPNLLEYDRQSFAVAGYNIADANAHHIYFHKGLFNDTVWPAGPIAYAHLDGDWYDSTISMLKRITPFLSEGGYFVLDDVYFWSGAKNAFIDYFNVNLEWLDTQRNKECVSTVGNAFDQSHAVFRIKKDIRVVAQRLPSKYASKDAALSECKTDV